MPFSKQWELSADGKSHLLEEERYLSTEGHIHLTGIQALVRLSFDNLRFFKQIFPDKVFAYFISGYEGSPLGSLDINFRKIYPLLKQWKILHVPGGNEEAGANMMWGSQLHRMFGPAKVDGVIGAWYGKGPGVRRIADSEDHIQMAGLDKMCAAYLMSGDDHTSKSSTTPHQTDYIHFANHVPTAYPGNIQEILQFGKRATIASMISGLAINLKLETSVCDGSQEFALDPEEDRILAGQFLKFTKEHPDYKRYFNPVLLKPYVLMNEEELFSYKLPLIREISRAFSFDTWSNRQLKSDFGIVATGKCYYDLITALKELNIAEDEVEVYKPMITWPPDMVSFREFAHGKKEIIVIEEKQAFFETHVKNELFNAVNRPVIVGKYDEYGMILFRENAGLDTDMIAMGLGKRLSRKEQFKDRKVELSLERIKKTNEIITPISIKRPPSYCSGCQHRTALELSGFDMLNNTADSTIVQTRDLDGKAVTIEITPKHLLGIGIGCSTMSIVDTLASNRSVVVGPMESEGLLWMGAAAFSYRLHVDQGCGDGTYFHSARLNISFIRDAIAHLKTHYDIDDTHQTLLYVDNNVVAMTGGQRPVGQDNPEIAVAGIKMEGIENVAIVAEYPEKFKSLASKYGIEVYDKSDTLKVKEDFSKKPGLSVIWYVQKCAIEKNRERRKNQDTAPKMRVHVNTEVCEDCGDCGMKAKCASVWKVDTEFGPKVRVHEYSCIQDLACAKGECPSYIKVYTKSGDPLKKFDLKRVAIEESELPPPRRKIDPNKVYEIYSVGIGGWGLLTAYEILARAATQEGKSVIKESDTGLSQKGGEVRDSLKISHQSKHLHEGSKIEAGGTDLYMASDLIGAVNPQNLLTASTQKTRAIINTQKIPTMPMIVGNMAFPDVNILKDIIDTHTQRKANIYVNATEIVERLFNDFKPTNIFLLGIAFQSIEDFPIEHSASIEDAIRTNNIEVEENIHAFRCGRLYAINPEKVLPQKPVTSRQRIEDFKEKLGHAEQGLYDGLTHKLHFDEVYTGKFSREIFELIQFQNTGYAKQFVDFVGQVYDFEQKHFPRPGFQLTKTVADNLYDLMAYKDEYRVADLLTRPEEMQKIMRQYKEGEIEKIRFLLRPPILQKIPAIKNLSFIQEMYTKDEKLEFPKWALDILKHFKFLRGTRLDIFSWGNEIRTQEKEAIAEYRQRIAGLLNDQILNDENYSIACSAAGYPSLSTGYEKVKMNHHKKAEDFWHKTWKEIINTSQRNLTLSHLPQE